MIPTIASIDLPTILLPGGPYFGRCWRGHDVGSGTDFHKALEAVQRGDLQQSDITLLENSLEPSPGHCSTMGTAATMAVIAEAMGIAPAGSCCIPAVDFRRIAMARNVGEYVMQLVSNNLRPTQIMTAQSLDSAIWALATVDGSSAAVMHLLSIAGRLGIDLKLEQFDRLSMTTPVLLKLKPSGEDYMNDFFNAGGVAALLNALGPQMHREVITVTVRTFGGEIAAAKIDDPRLIGTMEKPVSGPRGISVLFGNIAPNGAIIRTGLASPNHLVHRGRAAVFDGKAELDAKLNDPDFDVRPGDVIVLRGDGPKSSGMPESGPIPMPGKLLKQGITELVRITGSRLGGTVKQTAVLHVAPESTVGGPLGLVQTGAMIRLDVPNRRRQVEVRDSVLAARRKLADPPVQKRAPSRGYAKLVVQSVTQANRDAISIS